jgi:hypothetical protein
MRKTQFIFGLFLLLSGLAMLAAPNQHVFVKGANAFSHGALPTIPAYANANNHVAFFEQFNSTANFDLAQTAPSGKNWYTANQASYTGACSGQSAATPSWFTATNGIATLASNSAGCQGSELQSFG